MNLFHDNTLVGFGIALSLGAQLGCTRKQHTPQPLDSAKIPVEFALPSQHRDSIKSDLRSTLYSSVRFAISENSLPTSLTDARVFDASALVIAEQSRQRLVGEKSTRCEEGSGGKAFTQFINCVLQETIHESFSNSDDFLAAIRAILKDENQATLGDIKSLQESLNLLQSNTIRSFQEVINKGETLNCIEESLSQRIEAVHDAILLIRDGRATNDVPWISAKFFEGRKFVLTNSVENASVGVWMHAMNLSSQIVRMEVSSDHFYIIREKEGLYDSTSGIDLIMNSFPILDSRTVHGERYYQVNFALPDNKHFVLSQLGASGPDADLTVDALKVRVAHTEKPPLKEFATQASSASGLYFNASDQNLVLDELVLVNTNITMSDSTETPPTLFEKEPLRPTLRLAQGFFALDESSSQFENTQARELSDVTGELFSSAVEDRTEGKDEAYFSGSLFSQPSAGFGRSTKFARKYNVEKPIQFVISGNTPTAAIPIIKSTLDTFQKLFEKLTPAGKKVPQISALTQSEFEAKNRTEGLRIGGDITAADPRVNMIFWEENPNVPAAWATTAANPKTGEIISADVMMSGVSWGLNGCYAYLLRNWTAKPKPGDKPTPFPGAANHLMMQEGCRMVLLGMRLAGSPNITTKPADTKTPATNSGVDTDTLFEQNTTALKQSQSPNIWGINGLPDLLGALQKNAAHNNLDETIASALSGKNALRTKLDCVMKPSLDDKIFMSNAGVPGVTTQFIRTPQEAVLASIRGVLLHELGHTFGLRHNFIASTTQGELESTSNLPVPVATESDSLMDYTDDGVLMNMSAKKDYGAVDSSDAEPAFGMYDIFALSALYGLDTTQYKVKTKTPFCTDGNKNVVANCVPFDFGKNSLEHLLYQTNLTLQELRVAHDAELAYGAIGQQVLGRYQGLLGRYNSNLSTLWNVWGAYAQVAAYSPKAETQTAALKVIDKLFYGKGLEESYFSDAFFKAKTERSPMGIWDFLNVGQKDLTFDATKPQTLTALFTGILRNGAITSFVQAAPAIQAAGAKQNPDAQFLRGIRNINYLNDAKKSAPFAFRSILTGFFANKILLPENTPISNWEYFDSEGRKDGSDALDVNGNPIQITTAKPLFNYSQQHSTLPGVKIRADQSSKDVVALFGGTNDLESMVLAGAALTQVAPWGGSAGGSEAFDRITHDREILINQIHDGTVSREANEAAKFMVGFYDTLLATGFPALK